MRRLESDETAEALAAVGRLATGAQLRVLALEALDDRRGRIGGAVVVDKDSRVKRDRRDAPNHLLDGADLVERRDHDK
jgi:hypothetical protein